MDLALSTMSLMERRQLRETHRRADVLAAMLRGAALDARAGGDVSAEIAGVPRGDRPGRVGHACPDLLRIQHLHPTAGREQAARCLVGPVQANPEP